MFKINWFVTQLEGLNYLARWPDEEELDYTLKYAKCIQIQQSRKCFIGIVPTRNFRIIVMVLLWVVNDKLNYMDGDTCDTTDYHNTID